MQFDNFSILFSIPFDLSQCIFDTELLVCCDYFFACKFYIIIFLLWFAVCFSSPIHVLVSYNREWTKSGEHNGWTFTSKESKCIDTSREITYANLIDRLYDLLGYDRHKYDLVLKVICQLGGGIIALTVICNQ